MTLHSHSGTQCRGKILSLLLLLLLLLLFYLFIFLFCVHHTLARPLVMREHSSMAFRRWMLLLELWRIAVGRGTLPISATDCFRRLYLSLSPFLLAISSTETLCANAGERGRGPGRRTRTLGNMEVFTNRDTWRGTKDTHVATLGEGLAGELRDDARCCTRGQCQGSGRGLKKCYIDCVRSTDIFCTKYHEGRKLHGEQVVGYVVSGPLTTAVWKGSIYQRTSSNSGLVRSQAAQLASFGSITMIVFILVTFILPEKWKKCGYQLWVCRHDFSSTSEYFSRVQNKFCKLFPVAEI